MAEKPFPPGEEIIGKQGEATLTQDVAGRTQKRKPKESGPKVPPGASIIGQTEKTITVQYPSGETKPISKKGAK